MASDPAPARTVREGLRVHVSADLRRRNTFGLPAHAPLLIELSDAADLPRVFDDPRFEPGKVLMLGGGSNLLFAGDSPWPVLALTGTRIEMRWLDRDRAIVRADAGVSWHALVMHTLDAGLAGLENLALIPGTTGAAPIQNIGAYGVELHERIHAVDVHEPATGRTRRLDALECGFAYRDSLFKREPDRFIVTAVEFALARSMPLRPGYAGITEQLARTGVIEPTARDVADAVIAVRRAKLPDPALIGNAGSFFKNPIVGPSQAEVLSVRHPHLPMYPIAGDSTARRSGDHASPTARSKLSAAWMIEACGWKGHRHGDAGVSPDHALVLVNHGGASGEQMLALARSIARSVQETFDVAIEPEPRLVGAIW